MLCGRLLIDQNNLQIILTFFWFSQMVEVYDLRKSANIKKQQHIMFWKFHFGNPLGGNFLTSCKFQRFSNARKWPEMKIETTLKLLNYQNLFS